MKVEYALRCKRCGGQIIVPKQKRSPLVRWPIFYCVDCHKWQAPIRNLHT